MESVQQSGNAPQVVHADDQAVLAEAWAEASQVRVRELEGEQRGIDAALRDAVGQLSQEQVDGMMRCGLSPAH